MKIYVASSLGNKDQAVRVADALEAAGHKVTYRWMDIGAVIPAQYNMVADKEMKGVLDADMFVLLLPGRLGAHAEFGAAIARGIPILVLSPNYEKLWQTTPEYHPCIFYHHSRVFALVDSHPEKSVPLYARYVLERPELSFHEFCSTLG